MTPSFTYQKHSQSRVSQDLEFSPLSSPAIVPQYPRQHQHHSFLSNNGTNQSQHRMTPHQIYQQYEQLEHAKMMITRRLSELQSQQEREVGLQQQRSHMNHNINNVNNVNTSGSGQPQLSQPHTMPPALAPAPTTMEHPQQGGNAAAERMLEPATPSSLMNLRTRQQQQQQQPAVMEDHSQHPSQPLTPPSSSSSSTSSSGTRRLRRNTNTGASTTRRSKDVGPKKIRRESASHTSPRTLKPLLISPTLKAGGGGGGNGGANAAPELAPRSSVQDAERILATRSNYQNLMEGKAAALGIAFSPNIRSGLEIRRTAHKAAEQKRRDSLKEWFDRLRREVEDGYVKKQVLPSAANNATKDDGHDAEEEEEAQTDANGLKPLSKVLLLRYAYEYISSLKNTIQDRDTRVLKLEEENKNLKKRKAGDVVEDEDEDNAMTQAEQ
ncbi:hypothetical protein BCR43DRAFT_487582 [Syncephalastrum racemosum]|uniref:BHLH domain-containing protein n=1 Tax=Syncephalastrum racemosum TaxID=13706 RepID=A0A1X2HHG9_SYNRA|nr:hypothetical protein BCR43DRAFT_487582 [Syncephalastrum racemosum]